jgi:5'-3' exonuclease
VVVTGDKDLMQLIGPSVRLWDTMRDKWTDAAAVEAASGYRPSASSTSWR